MKPYTVGIFNRIGIFIFILISTLSLLFIIVTYLATTAYYQASTQIVNKDVAAHIAKFSSPFIATGFNRKRADSVFYNAMIISPNMEIYFLDTAGKVLYYHSQDSLIKTRYIPLSNIFHYIHSPKNEEIKGTDPKEPDIPKIFSAAEVHQRGRKIGYIYVILMSKEYRNVAGIVFKGQLGSLAIKAALIVVVVTLIVTLLYTSRLQRRFNQIIVILDRFKGGDLRARFDGTYHKTDEFFPIIESFDKMAGILELNFNKQKELEKERKNFLASISHDLRTPLSVARGYTETLILEKSEDLIINHQYIDLVLSQILKVEKLVLQLFELSKMESVNFEPVKQPFVFSEILQEILHGAKFQAHQKNITVDCINCRDTTLIYADIGMMERVVQNLLENAIKYSGIYENIVVELFDEANQLACRIDNTGIPLPAKLLNWVNNTDEDVVNRPESTGLGLALVKRTLRLHGFFFIAGLSEKNTNYFTFRMNKYNARNL